MPNHITVGLFEADTNLDQVVLHLLDHGFAKTQITVLKPREQTQAAGGSRSDLTAPGLTTLFGDQPIPDVEAEYFYEGVRRGGAVIAVTSDSRTAAEEAAGILDRHGAVDIEKHAAQWRATGWQTQKAAKVADAKTSELLDRATQDEYQSGRTRGSRVFVW